MTNNVIFIKFEIHVLNLFYVFKNQFHEVSQKELKLGYFELKGLFESKT